MIWSNIHSFLGSVAMDNKLDDNPQILGYRQKRRFPQNMDKGT